ncbi:MAG TPA: AAA domain-containing protein, partial [Tepidisphaeraceae bacterium]|nr:AAA domain-containing protein [Tepidisphaeraceae bacterium]
MVDRLLAAMVNGPAMNCRPHNSRQRVDFAWLSRLRDKPPGAALLELLSDDAATSFAARVRPPKAFRGKVDATVVEQADVTDAKLSPEERDAMRAWSDQTTVFTKLRGIAEDARTYEHDTGVHVLHVGFPLLSLPPGSFGTGRGPATRRVLAPIAFVPVNVTVKAGTKPAVEIDCRTEGIDRVQPNEALLAWLEQQTGVAIAATLYSDEQGQHPWREICELTQHVAKLVGIEPPPAFADAGPAPAELTLVASPKGDEGGEVPSVVCAAVLGLYPLANQALLRDAQAMADADPSTLRGPVRSFIAVGDKLEAPADAPPSAPRRDFTQDRLVTTADPCQARAVRLARACPALVVHGPPGTGKSQTITNIIGDHLVRGQRVLFVCDKRTALDVVANRLEHLGLGRLCAVVHDPQRDQRELYRSIREQLDALPELRTDAAAEARLAKLDADLQATHAELTAVHAALMHPPAAGAPSFHDLVGRWLAVAVDPSVQLDTSMAATATLAELEAAQQDVHDVLVRSADVDYPANPWRKCAGVPLATFLARPMARVRAVLGSCATAAKDADVTVNANIPPFPAGVDLVAAGTERAELAERLASIVADDAAAIVAKRWATTNPDAVARARQQLADVGWTTVLPRPVSGERSRETDEVKVMQFGAHPSPRVGGEGAVADSLVRALRAGPLDAELAMTVRADPPAAGAINEQLATLAAYLDSAKSFLGFLAFGRKSAAAAVLNRYGLTRSPANAERVRSFLTGFRARLALSALVAEWEGRPASAHPTDDGSLDAALSAHAAVLDVLHDVRTDPLLKGLDLPVASALMSPDAAAVLIEGLRQSPARAAAVATLVGSLAAAELFAADWLAGVDDELRAGKEAGETVAAIADNVDTLEGVLRVRESLATLRPTLQPAVKALVRQSADPTAAEAALLKVVLHAEIVRRLAADPLLQGIDGQRMKSSFERYRALEAQKQLTIRDAILHAWGAKQRDRLLAATGSRLKAAGAELKRRLTTRGERAMRLRQVVAVGATTDGGDPLFDLRPIWMASPETVAQLFPREARFEVVVFDEASQCRLEEALPVLLRGQRVVIAGDPKQLPPTRFFESAVATSDDDEEIETDQQLFEAQQAEVEDLLGAALGLDIQQCYLDVHYRSRNADLIGFSNEQFYGSRLQAIPGHPKNRTRFAPVTLYRSDGTYEKRANANEAERVVQIVSDLLRRASPPSIGVACFNLVQRDLIV